MRMRADKPARWGGGCARQAEAEEKVTQKDGKGEEVARDGWCMTQNMGF